MKLLICNFLAIFALAPCWPSTVAAVAPKHEAAGENTEADDDQFRIWLEATPDGVLAYSPRARSVRLPVRVHIRNASWSPVTLRSSEFQFRLWGPNNQDLTSALLIATVEETITIGPGRKDKYKPHMSVKTSALQDGAEYTLDVKVRSQYDHDQFVAHRIHITSAPPPGPTAGESESALHGGDGPTPLRLVSQSSTSR